MKKFGTALIVAVSVVLFGWAAYLVFGRAGRTAVRLAAAHVPGRPRCHRGHAQSPLYAGRLHRHLGHPARLRRLALRQMAVPRNREYRRENTKRFSRPCVALRALSTIHPVLPLSQVSSSTFRAASAASVPFVTLQSATSLPLPRIPPNFRGISRFLSYRR